MPPLTPAKRKRLQQAFEAANMQMRQEQYDYATHLFTQCVLGDPSNPSYAQGFIANLKQKYNNNKRGSNLAVITGLGVRAMVKKAAMQKDWMAVIKHGLESLKINPWHVGTLQHMARACGELDCLDSQLVYLKTALEAQPKDPEVNRACAIALRAKKQFDQAIACWHRVEQARPNDEEAARAIASLSVEKTIVEGRYSEDVVPTRPAGRSAARTDAGELTPEQRLERDIRRNPKDLTKYVELSELYIREELYSKAAEVLSRAVEVSGGDLEMRERLEDVQMRHLRQQLARAEKQYQQTGREEDKRRFEDLKRQVFQKDLEMCKNRVERYPNNLAFRYELGLRYQLTGRYNEAIAEYQLARNDPRRKGLCILALGECFQQIKQYRLAMSHFESAIEEIPDRDAENKKKALYRAGRLALALREIDTAERHLTALAGMDFAYRDVSALLDKISQIRKNTEAASPAPAAAEEPVEETGPAGSSSKGG
ncbi:MAG: tetratricopeptide repeat protein [Thermoguttaceae bacterium]